MKFLFNLFKKEKTNPVQRRNRPNLIADEHLKLALDFGQGKKSLGDVQKIMNFNTSTSTYTFITNSYKKLIDKGILKVVQEDVEVCELDNYEVSKEKEEVLETPIATPTVSSGTYTYKRQYKRVLQAERFTKLMNLKGLQLEDISKNAQLKIKKYNILVERLKFIPEGKQRRYNETVKKANELENYIFDNVLAFDPEMYKRKLDYLKKCGFIKDKGEQVDGFSTEKKTRKRGKTPMWKAEAISVLGSKKIAKPPTPFMRTKYPNLIEYVNVD